MKITYGNLLTATETYLCQICNCVSVKPHGLSQYLHPNPYEKRRAVKGRNLAVPADRPLPGTIEILDDKIVCMYGQVGMGKPFSFNNKGGALCPGDTYEQREVWFAECLEKMAALTGTFAMPFNIGCGLAGGNWERYRAILEASAISDRLVLYKVNAY